MLISLLAGWLEILNRLYVATHYRLVVGSILRVRAVGRPTICCKRRNYECSRKYDSPCGAFVACLINSPLSEPTREKIRDEDHGEPAEGADNFGDDPPRIHAGLGLEQPCSPAHDRPADLAFDLDFAARHSMRMPKARAAETPKCLSALSIWDGAEGFAGKFAIEIASSGSSAEIIVKKIGRGSAVVAYHSRRKRRVTRSTWSSRSRWLRWVD